MSVQEKPYGIFDFESPLAHFWNKNTSNNLLTIKILICSVNKLFCLLIILF